MAPVHLLYVGLKNDYGVPARGPSYEHTNFLGTLLHLEGVHTTFFPVDEQLRRLGRREMNEELLRVAQAAHPDLVFFVLFTDEVTPGTIREIRGKTGALTLNWFGDDHWRFYPYSRHWARNFDWVVTTDSAALARYHSIGCTQVILSQWGFNHFAVPQREIGEEFDVTFVGQVHSRRKAYVKDLRQRGIEVRCWGRGWENGRLAPDDLWAMFRRSRINLNFTESSVVAGWKPLVKVFLRRRANDAVVLNSPRIMRDNLRAVFSERRRQIKGRNFEIPGAGGFLMTSDAADLRRYFIPDREIVLFSSSQELAEKIRYFLAHPADREAIREAGHRRALRDHTYERRFTEILQVIGLLPSRERATLGQVSS